MKKNSKGFTLIELLVVVAIIGILAAVGVVAYNGYTNSAKKGSTKSIHGNVLKYIAAETKKCDLGVDDIMKAGTLKLSCATLTGSGGNAKTVVDHLTGTSGLGKILKSKNPWSPTKSGGGTNFAVQGGSKFTLGQISLSSSSNTLTLKTCIDGDCSKTAEQIEDTVDVK